MRKFLYQLGVTVISLAILIFFFQIMWFLAIPILIIFLSIWIINAMKLMWAKGKVPPTNSKVHSHQIIDVEYQEIDK